MKNIHLFLLGIVGLVFCLIIIFIGVVFCRHMAEAAYSFDTFSAKPPIHVLDSAGTVPHGLSPNLIKNIYHLFYFLNL